jgi:predicted thioesterase
MVGSMARAQRLQFEHVVQVAATPTQVLAAFFDPEALDTLKQYLDQGAEPRLPAHGIAPR